MAHSILISTDASKLDWWFSLSKESTRSQWNAVESIAHINVLEPIKSIYNDPKDCHIRIRTDGTREVSYIPKYCKYLG